MSDESDASLAASRSIFRILLLFLAAAWLAAAYWIPGAWFRPAAINVGAPPPKFDGMVLMRLCLLLEGAALAGIALWRTKRDRRAEAAEALVPKPTMLPDLGHGTAMWGLVALSILAAVLRANRLDSGLWLDEISPVLKYGRLSPVEVLTTYLGSSNHVMNTMLVNESVSLFGRNAWAIRLPAAIFGVATVPALYFVGRQALSRRASLMAAALLAVSYHHVFFSQNARGYSAYLFFSVLACGFVSLALQTRRTRDWVLYSAAAVLDVAALLNGAFVIAAHGLIALGVAHAEWRRRGSTRLLLRVVAVYAAIGLLVLHLYSLVIPQALVVMNTVYKMQSAGFSSPFSPEFIRDLMGGVSPAVVVGASVALPVLAIVIAIGVARTFLANRVLAAALILPNVLLLAFVLIEQVAVTPRLFIFGLIPACLFFSAGVEWMAYRLARRWNQRIGNGWFTAAAVACVAISLLSLTFYYATPKQNYVGAVDYLRKERKPNEILIVAYLARDGYLFYADERRVRRDGQTYFVRDEALFDKIVSENPGRQIWVLSTFERALKLDYPRIDAALQSKWTVAKRFPGLIGDGNIIIYKLKRF